MLIPEAPWKLSRVLEWLEQRLPARGHAVIVVAEGAESREQAEAAAASASSSTDGSAAAGAGAGARRDASGNVLPEDVGLYLKERITEHFKRRGTPANVKYIDPSYIIRSSPAIASDSRLCTNLAYNVVHGAMAGYTGFTVGTVDGHYVMLPISVLSTMPPSRIDITGRLYSRMCATTGMPNMG